MHLLLLTLICATCMKAASLSSGVLASSSGPVASRAFRSATLPKLKSKQASVGPLFSRVSWRLTLSPKNSSPKCTWWQCNTNKLVGLYSGVQQVLSCCTCWL